MNLLCFGDVNERRKMKNQKYKNFNRTSRTWISRYAWRALRYAMTFAVIIYYYYRWTLYQWTNIIFTLELFMRMVLPRFSCRSRIPVCSRYIILQLPPYVEKINQKENKTKKTGRSYCAIMFESTLPLYALYVCMLLCVYVYCDDDRVRVHTSYQMNLGSVLTVKHYNFYFFL